MARIRTIKPEFWTNERVMACSRDARLLFIGMWSFADDEGRLRYAERTLSAQIFPEDDDVTTVKVGAWLGELADRGLVYFYEVDERRFIQIIGWDHQKISHPTPSKIPCPVSCETETPEKLQNDSGAAPESFRLYRIGEERIGKDLNSSSQSETKVKKEAREENFGTEPPRHLARSGDGRFVYLKRGTSEFEAYSHDYEEGRGETPAATRSGRWFKILGET